MFDNYSRNDYGMPPLHYGENFKIDVYVLYILYFLYAPILAYSVTQY